MTTIINLTPHDIVVYAEGSPVGTFKSQGDARVTVSREVDDFIDINGFEIPVHTSKTGAVTGLPEDKPGTLYVVSRMVVDAARNRHDLIHPDELVRDAQGRPIGTASFGRA